MFVTDLVIFALPMKTLANLQMSRKKKVYVMILCGLGIVSCGASLARFTTLPYTKNTTDTTYAIADSLVWMCVEWSLGVFRLSRTQPLSSCTEGPRC